METSAETKKHEKEKPVSKPTPVQTSPAEQFFRLLKKALIDEDDETVVALLDNIPSRPAPLVVPSDDECPHTF